MSSRQHVPLRRALLAAVLVLDGEPLPVDLSAPLEIPGADVNTPLAPNPCPRVTHDGPDFSDRDLSGENFSNQDLTGADFTNAKLEGATFTGATLSAADFTSATLGQTNFSSADLTDACFYTATVSTTNFQFAKLPCTVFDATDLSLAIFGPNIKAASPSGSCRTSFQHATLNCEFVSQWKDLELHGANVQACFDRLAGVDFSNAHMDGIVFSGLVLSKSRWVGAHLQGAFFIRSDLKEADLSNADLRRAQLSKADATDAVFRQAQLSGAHLSGVVLKGADLTGTVLQGADGLPAADLSLAFMPDTTLTDAKMTGANLSHVNFYGALARADNATMQNVDFSNANLGSVDLTQGRLKGVNMDAAVLVNARLEGADLTRTPDLISTSLVQANLQGANFSDAKLGGANLSNAAVALEDGVVLFKAPVSLAGDLDRRELSAEVVTAFKDNGYSLVSCTDPAVVVEQATRRWQLLLGSPTGSGRAQFKKFLLVSDSNIIDVRGLSDAGPSESLFEMDSDFAATLDEGLLASGLLEEFTTNGFPLPPCTNPVISVKSEGNRWALGESLTQVTVASLGYTRFNLILEGSHIQIYGSEVTIIRDEGGRLTLVPVSIRPTILSPDSFDTNTTCPNQISYGANVRDEVPWKEMMTAATPPPPPSCIPSPTRWCN